MSLRIESVAAEYLQPCALKFKSRDTNAVVSAYRKKSDCDDADKAAARAELGVLIGAED